MTATIKIKDEQKGFFENLAQILGTTITFEEDKEKEFLNKLERSYKQARLHKEGKIQLKNLNQVLDEL